MTIRAARPTDRDQIARICLLTGRQGGDATGVFGDDAVLADVYAVPYLEGPGCFGFVWDVDGQVRGYLLGAADTSAYQEWFAAQWWPRVGHLHPRRTPDDEWLHGSAADPQRMMRPCVEAYPAHLHIDLLPDQQGRGVGRALIEAACGWLRALGVPGVHLVAERANVGAQAFYPRVGFTPVDGDDATVTFARALG